MLFLALGRRGSRLLWESGLSEAFYSFWETTGLIRILGNSRTQFSTRISQFSLGKDDPRPQWSMHAKLSQTCTILCDPRDCSPPGSSVHGILQARILEWVAMPSSRDLPDPGDGIPISCIGRQLLYHQGHLRSPTVRHPVTIQLRTELLQPILFLDT